MSFIGFGRSCTFPVTCVDREGRAIDDGTTFRLLTDEARARTANRRGVADPRDGGGSMEKQDFGRFHPMRQLGDAVDRGARSAQQGLRSAARSADTHLRGRALTQGELGMIR